MSNSQQSKPSVPQAPSIVSISISSPRASTTIPQTAESKVQPNNNTQPANMFATPEAKPAVKRAINTNEQVPSPKQFHPNSVTFANSKVDSKTVNIIVKSLVEFSEICTKHGFQLSVQCGEDRELDVRLAQNGPTSSLRDVISDIDKLLDSKRKKEEASQQDALRTAELWKKVKKELEANVRTNEQNTTTIDTLRREKNQQTSEMNDMKKRLSKKKKELNAVRNSHTDPDFFLNLHRNRFFDIYPESFTKWEEPLDQISELIARSGKYSDPLFVYDRLAILKEYLKLVCGHGKRFWSENESEIEKKLCDFLNEHWFRFACACGSKQRSLGEAIKKQYDLKNVVGTVHEWSQSDANNTTHHILIAVVDMKIINWGYGDSKNIALKMLFERIRSDQGNTGKPGLFKSSKLAMDMIVDPEFADVFVHSPNKDLYKNGHKIIQCLKPMLARCAWKINIKHVVFVFAFYNQAMTYFESRVDVDT